MFVYHGRMLEDDPDGRPFVTTCVWSLRCANSETIQGCALLLDEVVLMRLADSALV